MSPMQPTAPNPTPRPSLSQLFIGFSRIGLAGLGGVLPWARRFLVEQARWLRAEEFNTLLGLCQFLPGPNVVNLAVVVGRRFRGPAGALVAALGLLAGPVTLVIGLGGLYDLYGGLPLAQSVLRGISAVGAGLLMAMSLRMSLVIYALFGHWERLHTHRWRQAIQTGVAPLAVGLVFSSGVLIAQSAGLSLGLLLVIGVTVVVNLKNLCHPLWLIVAGAVAGSSGWLS